MKKKTLGIFILFSALFFLSFSKAENKSSKIAVVNFATCVTDSKCGKQEQENLEYLRKQMASMIEATENEIKEITSKFEDAEYMDSLSPKADEELRMKYQALNEDLARYQNQFYQVINQANYQLIQKMNTNISKAAQKIARQKNLAYVMNKEACFYYNQDLEITGQVIKEMDFTFEKDQKKKQLSKAEEMKNKSENQTETKN